MVKAINGLRKIEDQLGGQSKRKIRQWKKGNLKSGFQFVQRSVIAWHGISKWDVILRLLKEWPCSKLCLVTQFPCVVRAKSEISKQIWYVFAEKKIPQTHLPEVGRRIRHYWTVAVKVSIVPPSSQAKWLWPLLMECYFLRSLLKWNIWVYDQFGQQQQQQHACFYNQQTQPIPREWGMEGRLNKTNRESIWPQRENRKKKNS